MSDRLVKQLRIDADEIAGWGAGNEAGNVRAAADRIERQNKRTGHLVEQRDRIKRNRDMWKGQCERQAEELARLRAALSTALKQGEAEGLRKAAVDEAWQIVGDAMCAGQHDRRTLERIEASLRRALLPDEEKPGSGEAG